MFLQEAQRIKLYPTTDITTYGPMSVSPLDFTVISSRAAPPLRWRFWALPGSCSWVLASGRAIAGAVRSFQ